MLSFNFDYYQPSTIQEALEQYKNMQEKQKKPMYFAGGTEILTLGRSGDISADAIIDIKHIPECQLNQMENDKLVLGAALSLTKIRENQIFPLLEETIAEIADNTARNKITLGGNICANIIYRQAVLPLLLSDSQAVIAGAQGLRNIPFNDIFKQRLKLKDGELLIQVITEKQALQWPYFTRKKRRQWSVGYPLITLAVVVKKEKLHLAFSGLCAYPFQSQEINEVLNREDIALKDRIELTVEHIPDGVLNDVHGSDQYRLFVWKNMIQEAFDFLGKEKK